MIALFEAGLFATFRMLHKNVFVLFPVTPENIGLTRNPEHSI